MNTQHIIHSTPDGIRLAALLYFMGYAFKFDSAARSFLFSDPGDLSEAVQAYEDNVQVASAKTLLEVYDEFLTQLQAKPSPSAPMGDGVELLPMTILTQEGREWTTRDPNTATLLLVRGNELIHSYAENGKTIFVFSFDDGLTELVSLYNRKKLRVEPHQWAIAAYKVRDIMRDVKDKERNRK